MNDYEAKAGFKTFLLLSLLTLAGYWGLRGSRWGYQLLARADLSTPPPENIRLLSLKTHTAVITWTTATETSGYLLYGPSKSLGKSTLPEASLAKTHIAVLENLFPGTTYYYKIGVNKEAFGKNEAEPFSLVTPTF